MNTRRVLCLSLVAAAATLHAPTGAAATSQAASSPPGAAQASPAVSWIPAGGDERVARVALDLQAHGSDVPVRLTCPPAQHFEVVATNAVAARRYRTRYDWVLAPTTRSTPPARALHRDEELRASTARLLPPKPGCVELSRLAAAVLAAEDEAATAAARNAMLLSSDSGSCPELERKFIDFLVRSAVERPGSRFTLYPGDRVQYVVERLAHAGTAVDATWRFELSADVPKREWPATNERSWVVAETARAVIDMARFAQRRPLLRGSIEVSDAPGTADRLAYALTYTDASRKPRRTELRLPDHIWSPEGYAPLAALELAGTARKPADGPTAAVPGWVLDPRLPALAAESRRVSARLAAGMLDPGAHEEAALLLGVFSLREAAGPFSDTRPALCRMAAHLAMAHAIRGDSPSRAAAAADALLLTLVNRQKLALARIAAIEASSPGPAEAALLTALRIRITGDWRLLEKPDTACLLLRLEHYRALQRSLGGPSALDYLHSLQAAPGTAEWGRVAAQQDISVEQGNALLARLVELELGEVSAVWKVVRAAAQPPSDIQVALEVPGPRLFAADVQGRARPEVIDWGLWAAFFRRNLCFDSEASVGFLERMLRLPEEAAAQRLSLRSRFSRLWPWPFVEVRWAQATFGTPKVLQSNEYRKPACSGIGARALTAAQDITSAAWERTRACNEQVERLEVPPLTEWVDMLALPGTALFDVSRLMARSGPSDPASGAEALGALHELAPFDREITEMLPYPPKGREAETVRARYGPLLQYDQRAMSALALLAHGEEAVELRRKLAEMNPDDYLRLGSLLVDLGREEEAAAAYERAIERARDRVAVSIGLRWLIGYYCDHGRLDRAEAVARMAADVYSAGGLAAMGYLMERLGRYTDAEAWYRRILERYEGHRYLDAFYIRYEHRVADGRYKQQAVDALARVFPNGMRRVTVSDFEQKPAQTDGRPEPGIPISGVFERLKELGLREGDLLVALNGYAVETDRQYQLLWTLDDHLEATAIVRRDGRYLEIRGKYRGTRYGPVATGL